MGMPNMNLSGVMTSVKSGLLSCASGFFASSSLILGSAIPTLPSVQEIKNSTQELCDNAKKVYGEMKEVNFLTAGSSLLACRAIYDMLSVIVKDNSIDRLMINNLWGLSILALLNTPNILGERCKLAMSSGAAGTITISMVCCFLDTYCGTKLNTNTALLVSGGAMVVIGLLQRLFPADKKVAQQAAAPSMGNR